jgi:hypothetical protein
MNNFKSHILLVFPYPKNGQKYKNRCKKFEIHSDPPKEWTVSMYTRLKIHSLSMAQEMVQPS